MLTRISSLAAGLTLTLGSVAVATGASAQAPTPTEPCAKQAAQVEKAELALERLTAVFDRQLAKGKSKNSMKAQVQRLAKAQERLATCEAGLLEG